MFGSFGQGPVDWSGQQSAGQEFFLFFLFSVCLCPYPQPFWLRIGAIQDGGIAGRYEHGFPCCVGRRGAPPRSGVVLRCSGDAHPGLVTQVSHLVWRCLSSRQRQRLRQLDMAYAYLRHIIPVHVDSVLAYAYFRRRLRSAAALGEPLQQQAERTRPRTTGAQMGSWSLVPASPRTTADGGSLTGTSRQRAARTT